MAQLVIIPAVIVIICISISVMFGLIAGTESDIETHLARLRQSGGRGRELPMNMQDPRYKDRSLAAFNVATMIPSIQEPAERGRISGELIEILTTSVADHEETLQMYLLLAIGQLGQAGGLDVLMTHAGASSPRVRQGAIGGILSWQDRNAARATIPTLTTALADTDPLVVTEAAMALGQLAQPQDAGVVPALRGVLDRGSVQMRDAVWNAAVALARLGESKGSRIVVDVLLDRAALKEIAQADRGMQDRVILSTLEAAENMTDPRIWDKIKQLADDDPNPRVQAKARNLLTKRVKVDK